MHRSETDAPARSEECHSSMMGRGDAALGEGRSGPIRGVPQSHDGARGCSARRRTPRPDPRSVTVP